MNEYAMEIREVSKSYPDGGSRYHVLRKIDLQVQKGELIAVMGPSGSGKSTLLSIAGALLSPDEGDIIIGQQNISGYSQKKWTQIRREQIGFIFQNHQLLPFLTVKEQLELVYDLKKDKGKKSPIQELILDLGLSDCQNKYPGILSGGEKQRTAIARAFMNDPQLILADEPTASLDKERGLQVVELIRDEIKKWKKAGVMVTHDERILHLADRVYQLREGRLVLV